jgi:hypothetical protein
MRLLLRSVGLVAVLSLLAADAPQDPGDTLVVTRKTTKLRAQKRAFAPAVAVLKEGDRLAFQKKEGAWLSVKFDKLTGWLHEGDVSTKTDVRLSGDGLRENYSTSETAAAKKGFNPQVEKQYRDGNPNLERAFQLVDQLQGRAVSEDEIRAFLTAGKLIQEGK